MRRPNDVERRALMRGARTRQHAEVDDGDLEDVLRIEPTHPTERSIGDILRTIRALDDEQIERIVTHQRSHRVRFGEAAVALRLASGDEVLWALSQQFNFPYARSGGLESSRELIVASQPFSAEAEAFRELRSQLLADLEGPRHAFAIVSAERGDGRSYVAANLAIAFSQLGARTLLVDADLRRPVQHKRFNRPGKPGLSGILAGHVGNQVIQVVAGLPNLYLLTSGIEPPNPLELLQGPTFGLLMHRLLGRFEHVVVDTPAARGGSDWRAAAAGCGAAITIGRRGKSRMAELQRMGDHLQRARVRAAGVVMNDF